MPALIGMLLTALATLFRSRIGSWAVSVLAWFGLAWATQKFAVEPWLDAMKNVVVSTPGGEWGGAIVAYAGLMKFDQACTMIASAVATKFSVSLARAFLVRKT